VLQNVDNCLKEESSARKHWLVRHFCSCVVWHACVHWKTSVEAHVKVCSSENLKMYKKCKSHSCIALS